MPNDYLTPDQKGINNRQGRDFFSPAFIIYGLFLVLLFFYRLFSNISDADWAVQIYNTLEYIIPIIYASALVIYFLKFRIFLIALVMAIAYDIWFQYKSSGLWYGYADCPVFLEGILTAVIFGVFIAANKGFKRQKKHGNNDI